MITGIFRAALGAGPAIALGSFLSSAVLAQPVPRFEVDADWPIPWPEQWVVSGLVGLCIDSHQEPSQTVPGCRIQGSGLNVYREVTKGLEISQRRVGIESSDIRRVASERIDPYESSCASRIKSVYVYAVQDVSNIVVRQSLNRGTTQTNRPNPGGRASRPVDGP